MGNTVNFLSSRSLFALRKEIINISNSYSNSWDILCELTQNSFDAIRRYIKKYGSDTRRHSIVLEINVPKRRITIEDTGIGIQSDKVKEILAPNTTDKDGDMDTIGEKGVGLTYTIFLGNHFLIETQNETSYFRGAVKNASLWKNGKVNEVPQLEVMEERPTNKTNQTYTRIELEDIEKYDPDTDDIFNQPIEVFQFILRTRTVIGYLKGIFEEMAVEMDFTLRYTDFKGEELQIPIPFRYMLPEEFVGKQTINFEEFKQKAATYDDKQKTQKLRGKALYKKGAVTRSNRRINYYCFFAPSRNLWKDICDKNKLYYGEVDEEPQNLLSGGIYVATKGMPTGIIIEPPASGYSGYWANFFILLEDDSIVFDLGRKTIPSRTKGRLKEVAKSLFTEFLPYIKYVTSDPATSSTLNSTVQQVAKNKIFEEMKKYANLGMDQINYRKNPNHQEAAIVAIFHELVGAQILRGYYALSTGYKQTYDLWSNYAVPVGLVGDNYKSLAVNGMVELPCVIEFKYKAESIIGDLTDNIKFFNDMDLIICWDLDANEFAKNSIEVNLIDKDDVLFYGSNYTLTWPGSYNLGAASEKPVLALRKFIEDYLTNR